MSSVETARRQMEICNACRYCEGYCAVFPAMMRKRVVMGGYPFGCQLRALLFGLRLTMSSARTQAGEPIGSLVLARVAN